MKCIRCGSEVEENTKYCDNCGFSMEEQKQLVVHIEEDDPLLPKEEEAKLIDNPILTFIFGLITILSSIVIILDGRNLPIFILILCVLFFVLTFIFSTKVTKIKLKPVRNVGLILAYVGIALMLFKIFYVVSTLIIK